MNRTNSKQKPAANAKASVFNVGHPKAGPNLNNHSQSSGSSKQATNRQLAGDANLKFTSQIGGNMMAQQQQRPATNTTTTLPINNAPTSLANLAQLSGITLLPISSFNRLQQHNNLMNNLSAGPQASSSTSTSAANAFVANAISNNAPSSGGRQKLTSGSRTTSQTADATIQQQQHHNQKLIKINSQQNAYNLTTTTTTNILPAPVQLLNRSNNHTFNESMISGQWPATNQIHQQSNKTTTTTSRTAGGNRQRKTTKSQANLNFDPTSSQFNNNDIQVIPVSDGISVFNELSDLPPAQQSSSCGYDDLLSQPSLESSMQQDPSVDLNGELNNISLMKLMAILNNPALTITAVDSNSSHARRETHDFSPSTDELYDQSPQAAMNLLDNRQISITMANHGKGMQYNNQNEKSYAQNTSTKDSQNDVQPRSRVPQSAANLQLLNSTGALHPLVSSSPKRSQSIASRNSTARDNKDKSPNFTTQNSNAHLLNQQINWLSNYDTSNIISNSVSNRIASTSWSSSQSSRLNDLSNEHDKMNDPTLQSTSVRNLMMQQLPSSAKNSTVSVQLLKHIADQTNDNNWTSSQTPKSVSAPDCGISNSTKYLTQVIKNPAKYVEKEITVRSLAPKKSPKRPIQTTKNRLYLPPPECSASKHKKILTEPNFNLTDIIIDESNAREVLLSEQHHILNCMMSSSNNAKQKGEMSEPDEIFINRSKRVMSRIDTMVERKKRKRFERISGRSEPKTNSLEDQCAESEEEWSSDESQDHIGFIETQLPLQEIETEQKKAHLQCIGLVSRDEKNKILVEQYKEKLNVFSPLALEEGVGIPEDIKRFYDTILQSGGVDVQLRIETNIKRNDLPLIEGLNRNTSRMKMSYMSNLGLEKRSKRTTLYKMKLSESLSVNIPKQVDLNKVKPSTTEKLIEQVEMPKPIINERANRNSVSPMKLNITNCREVLRPTSKNDYMKSLGLMAS